MRITDDRYNQHRRGLDLAWRMIALEARTSTITRWTKLSGHRIRALYKSYAPHRLEKVTRHRGMSPYRLDTILNSPRMRCEAAMFAAICKSLGAVSGGRLHAPERFLPTLDRGELLCEAYEWFRYDISDARLNFEHGLLVLSELSNGQQIQLSTCRTCGGVMLIDRLSLGRLECAFCAQGSSSLASTTAASVESRRSLGAPATASGEPAQQNATAT